jgi:cold shock protein
MSPILGERCGERDNHVDQRDQGLWFIAPGTGGKDVFAHISAVERSSVDLRDGDKVASDVVENRGKESAENLRVTSEDGGDLKAPRPAGSRRRVSFWSAGVQQP